MMLPEVRVYLEEIRLHLHLDPVTEKRVIGELHTYFQEKVAELCDRGAAERDAVREAIRSFGRARVVARLTYEAYSKGSWTDAILSSFPHLIIAALFAFHLWRHIILAPIVFISIVLVTLFGWWHSKPNWLYSWVGYSLFPLIIAGYASYPTLRQAVNFLVSRQGSFPSIWLLLLICALFGVSLWVIVRTTVRVVRRDWILASLMLVPLPVFGSWLFNINQVGGLFRDSGTVMFQWDTSMVLVLSMLGATSATFIRLRKRVLKAGAVVTLGVIAGTIAGHNLWGNPGLAGFLLAALVTLLFLLAPALLEARIGHGEAEGVRWSGDWVHTSDN